MQEHLDAAKAARVEQQVGVGEGKKGTGISPARKKRARKKPLRSCEQIHGQ